MCAALLDPAQVFADAARLRATAVKDKSYKRTPLGNLAGRYLDELAFGNYSPKTVENREGTLYLLALDLAHLQPSEVTPDHLREFLADHWRDSASNTKAQHISNVRVFFAWAHDHDLIPSDPGRKLPRTRQKDTDRRAHGADVVRRLIVGQDSQRDRAAILLLYWCALRRNELRLVQFRHIDLADRVLTVFGKGGTVMEQNLPEPVALPLEKLILDRQAAPDEYLLYPRRTGQYGAYPHYTRDVIWEDKLRPLSMSGVDKWWRRCVAAAGVPHFPMHELRHTAGTHFHRTGHDLVATQHFLRHANPATTAKTYVHLDRVRAIAEVQRGMADPLGGDRE